MTDKLVLVHTSGADAYISTGLCSMLTAHAGGGTSVYLGLASASLVSTDAPADVAAEIPGMIALQAVANPGVDFYVNSAAIMDVTLSGTDNSSVKIAGQTAAIVTTQDPVAVAALANA